jgi:hypothetical protein
MITPTAQQQRARLLQEMASIDHMIRGHVSTQNYRVRRHGQTVIQGPYYVLQRYQDGRNQCQRIRDQEVEVITGHVLAYKRYMELAERYAALTEDLTWSQQSEAVKKKGSSGKRVGDFERQSSI